MEAFGEDAMEQQNLISGPPASRSVIENLKKLLTQRQHSRESDSDAHKENNGALLSTGSELDQSELSFYSHLTSSSSDSDDSDLIWGFHGGGTGNGVSHQHRDKESKGSTNNKKNPLARNGRRRRSHRNHSASSSSSSSPPPPQSVSLKRRRRPASIGGVTCPTHPLKSIELLPLNTSSISPDETTRVSGPLPPASISSDEILSSPAPEVDSPTGDGRVTSRGRDGHLRKRRREYINEKIRRNEWTEPGEGKKGDEEAMDLSSKRPSIPQIQIVVTGDDEEVEGEGEPQAGENKKE